MKKIILIAVMAGFLFAMGCGKENMLPKKRQFLVEVNSENIAKADKGIDKVAVVRAFRVSRPFSGNKLVCKTQKAQYEIDYYNEFAVSPGEMLAEQTRSWFDASDIFRVVSMPGLAVEADVVIEANVKKLYVDLSVDYEQSVVMDVEFLLYDVSGPEYELIETNSYFRTVDISNRKAENIIEGYKVCFENILRMYMNDIAGRFVKRMLD